MDNLLNLWQSSGAYQMASGQFAMILVCLVIFLYFAGAAYQYEKGRKKRLGEIKEANTRLQTEIEDHIRTGLALDAEKEQKTGQHAHQPESGAQTDPAVEATEENEPKRRGEHAGSGQEERQDVVEPVVSRPLGAL